MNDNKAGIKISKLYHTSQPELSSEIEQKNARDGNI